MQHISWSQVCPCHLQNSVTTRSGVGTPLAQRQRNPSELTTNPSLTYPLSPFEFDSQHLTQVHLVQSWHHIMSKESLRTSSPILPWCYPLSSINHLTLIHIIFLLTLELIWSLSSPYMTSITCLSSVSDVRINSLRENWVREEERTHSGTYRRAMVSWRTQKCICCTQNIHTMQPNNYRLLTMHRNISLKFLRFYLILFYFNRHFIHFASTMPFFHSQNVFPYDLILVSHAQIL